MSETIFIDSQFVIALVNRHDQHHEQALGLAERYKGERFLVTDAVLLEIGDALAKKFRRQAAQIIEDFLTSGDVHVMRLTPELFREALSLYGARQDKEWGLTDCVSFIVMRRVSVQDVLTLDHHFTQAGFRILMRKE